jgi:hypothetical protein
MKMPNIEEQLSMIEKGMSNVANIGLDVDSLKMGIGSLLKAPSAVPSSSLDLSTILLIGGGVALVFFLTK